VYIEIIAIPAAASAVAAEIGFVCSLFDSLPCAAIGVMYGVGCKLPADQHWQQRRIPTTDLAGFIDRGILDGIFEPGHADLFAFDSDRLIVRLCHEGDIHVSTASRTIVEACASRWIAQQFRLLRRVEDPPSDGAWHDVRSVEETAAGL
jgi:hypothetical protein